MRRMMALFAAAAIVVAFAGPSVAAGPPVTADRFVGNFVMLDADGTALGTVVANFSVPSAGKIVPGTLDVYWARDTSFPFPESLPYPPAKESHAQLVSGFFGPDAGGIVAGTDGYICDYSAPWNAECRNFSVIFVARPDGHNVVAWAFRGPGDPNPFDYTLWYTVGKGSFSLNYAGGTTG